MFASTFQWTGIFVLILPPSLLLNFGLRHFPFHSSEIRQQPWYLQHTPVSWKIPDKFLGLSVDFSSCKIIGCDFDAYFVVREIDRIMACMPFYITTWPYTGITEQAGIERCDGNGCCIISLDGGGAQEPQASAFNLSLGAEEADNQVMTEAPCFGTKLRLQACRMLPSSGVLWMNQVAPAHWKIWKVMLVSAQIAAVIVKIISMGTVASAIMVLKAILTPPMAAHLLEGRGSSDVKSGGHGPHVSDHVPLSLR